MNANGSLRFLQALPDAAKLGVLTKLYVVLARDKGRYRLSRGQASDMRAEIREIRTRVEMIRHG